MHEKEGRTEKSNRPGRHPDHRLFRTCGSRAVLSGAVLALAQGPQRRLEGVRCCPPPGTMVSGKWPPKAALAGDVLSSVPGRTGLRRWGSGISSQRAMGLTPGSAACPVVGQGFWALDLSLQSHRIVRARQVLSFESLPPENPTSAATWGPGADRIAQALHQRLWPEADVRSTRWRLSDTGPPAAPMMLRCRVNFPKIKHLQASHGAPDYRGQTFARRRQARPPPAHGNCAGAERRFNRPGPRSNACRCRARGAPAGRGR